MKHLTLAYGDGDLLRETSGYTIRLNIKTFLNSNKLYLYILKYGFYDYFIYVYWL